MRNQDRCNLGIMFRREHPPESLPQFARKAEAAGFDELWVVEDCFYASGIAPAAMALASTERITVGLGIMPAVARNPVFTAMEIATLARLYPGRFLPGIGHGMAGWMRQIGAFPKSQLAALEETTFTVREMLAGKRIDYDGKQVRLEGAELVHPPDHIPPVSLGVRGSKSLALSGRVADGTILAEYASPAYLRWAREQIAGGMETGTTRDHRLTVFAFTCAGETTEIARQQVRPLVAAGIASGNIDSQLAPMGILPQVQELRNQVAPVDLAGSIPDSWIDQLTIVGTREDWGNAIKRYVDAGADSVVLVPLPGKGLEEIDSWSTYLG